MNAPAPDTVSERACLIETLIKLTAAAKSARRFARDPDLTQTSATAVQSRYREW
jgi:hypothetical protein